jgi:hypothetical protein
MITIHLMIDNQDTVGMRQRASKITISGYKTGTLGGGGHSQSVFSEKETYGDQRN